MADATSSVAVSVSDEVAVESAVDLAGQELRQRIRIDLELRGVGTELALLLSEQLEERASGVDDEQYGSLLDGVALAVGVNAVAGEELVRNTSEIREVERMMSAFAGELSKLDETLEVLAAYVRRMRTNSTSRGNRVIH